MRIGADGTALVDEFLPLEVATGKGISVASATWLIRDIVNLKARHPLPWMQATRGLVPMFRACMLAAEVARFDLTVEQAQALDERLAPKVPTLPWRRVLHLARGLITELAAEKVTVLQQEARVARFVCKVPTDDPSTAYEIPDPIRRQVLLRDTVEVFPFSSRPPRAADLDHTVPYRPGGKRQTRASNLGPLSRKPHRAKTHAGWQLEQPKPGVFWWRTPTGERYRVGPNGTMRIGRNPRHQAYEQALWNSDHDVGGVGVGGDPEPRRRGDPQRE